MNDIEKEFLFAGRPSFHYHSDIDLSSSQKLQTLPPDDQFRISSQTCDSLPALPRFHLQFPSTHATLPTSNRRTRKFSRLAPPRRVPSSLNFEAKRPNSVPRITDEVPFEHAAGGRQPQGFIFLVRNSCLALKKTQEMAKNRYYDFDAGYRFSRC